jgi:hypothetical protein
MNDQMANPFRKPAEGGAARRPAPVQGTPKELVRLYVMALVFLMAIAGMVWMKKFGEPKPEPKKKSGEIDYTFRQDGAPEGKEKQADSPDAPPAKKVVPLQDVPKEGAVDFKKLAEPFRDGLEKPVKETPEFVAVLRTMINAVPAETATKLVNPELNGDAAYLDPVKARGEMVRVYGQMLHLYTEPLDTTIPENRSHVYLGFMTEYKTNRTVAFYLADLPVDPATGQRLQFSTKQERSGNLYYRDWVEVEGVFLRRYDYVSQKTDDQGRPVLARSTLLFGRNLKLASSPKISNSRTGYVVGVSITAAMLVVIVLVAGIMTRRYGKGSLKERMKALKGPQPPPAFPKPDPAKQLLGAEVPAASPPPTSEAPPAPPSPPAP